MISIFMNITNLVSPMPEARDEAITLLGIMGLGFAGIAFKNIYDTADIKIGKNIIHETLTETVYERLGKKSFTGMLWSLFWFAVNFGVSSVLSYFIFGIGFNANILGVWGEKFTSAMLSSVSEELFFTFALLPILCSELGVLGVPINVLIFVAYHGIVYHQFTQLLYIGIIRTVYSVTYLFHRRLTPSILAHFLNNVLVSFGA